MHDSDSHQLDGLLARRNRSLPDTYRLFYDEPVHLVRGEGTWLYDAGGRRYLDAYNNVAVVGHCHPDVVAALCAQARLLNTHTRYLSEPIVAYAEALLQQFDDELDRVVFTCTGSEANDLACRVASDWTGGEGFIVTANAYHGTTRMSAALSPSLHDRPDARVRTVAPPDISVEGDAEPGRFGADVAECAKQMRADGVRPAALIIDTIMSSDGIVSDPVGLLGPAVDAIHSVGGLFIADEIQAGFGRLGTGMWGFARHGVAPDLVTLGKPMGNGHPVAGLVGRRSLFKGFGDRVRYFNTFAGNPVSAAVGQAVLDVIARDRLIGHASAVGAELRSALVEIAERHEAIREVRGCGLFIGVQITDPTGGPGTKIAPVLVNAMRDRNVLISSSGPNDDVLKIRPPLVFGHDEVGILADALEDCMTECDAGADDAARGR